MKDTTKPFTNCLKEIVEAHVHMCQPCPTFKTYFTARESDQLLANYILEKGDRSWDLWENAQSAIAQMLISMAALPAYSRERGKAMFNVAMEIRKAAKKGLENETDWLMSDLYDDARANSPRYKSEQDEVMAERQHLANWSR